MISSERGSFIAAARKAFNCIVFLFCALVFCGPLHAEIGMGQVKKKKDKPAPMVPPPLAAPVTVQVERGGEVRVPLRLVGVPGQTEFVLKRAPRAGKLAAMPVAGPSEAAVIYRHGGARGGAGDAFSYAVKTARGVSSPAVVKIVVVEAPPILSLPERLDMGEVRMGTRMEREFFLENRGGDVAEGELEVDAPWRIEGTREYAVEGGKRQAVTLALDTSRDGVWRGSLRATGVAGGAMELLAVVVAPVVMVPETVVLKAGEDDPVRAAQCELVNRTDEPQRVELVLGARLHGTREVELAPGGRQTLTLQTDAADTAALEETVQLVGRGFLKNVPVRAAAVGPVLRASAKSLALGRVPLDQPGSALLTVQNVGGERVYVSAVAARPFHVAAEDGSFTLEPGQSREMSVAVEASLPGSFTGALELRTYGKTLPVALTAEVFGERPLVAQAAATPLPVFAQAEPVAGEKPNGPRPPDARVLETTKTTARLAWAVVPGATDYRIEARLLRMTGQKLPQIVWAPVTTAKYSKTGKKVDATMTELPPGKILTLRVLALDAGGGASEPSVAVQVALQKPRRWRMPWSLLGGILVAGLLGFLGWQRWKESSGWPENISQG